MRTTTGAENNLLALPQRAHWARLLVDRGTGTFVDLTTLEGYDWLRSLTVRDNVDDATAIAQIRLQRAIGLLNLAPLVDGSKLNDGGTLIDVGHELVIEAATMPIGVRPVTANWKELFRGFIDEIDWPDDMMLSCRDLGGELMDTFIINQKVYGSSTGELLEDVTQDIVDDANPSVESITANYTWNGTTTVTMSDTSQVVVGDYIGHLQAPFFEISVIVPSTSVTILNPSSRTIPTGSGASASLRIPDADRVTLFSVTGDATTPFKVADSPGWALKSFKSGRDHVLPRIRSLSQQIGWECRYRWQSNVGGFRLTLYEPDRAKNTPDWTHTKSLYNEPKQLKQSRATIRNWVEVTYGRAGARTTTISQDAASQAKYGFRPMAIAESSSSQIDTLTEADKMADAALADLKDPGVVFGVPVPFFWPVQTGDLHRFGADDRRYDSDQDLAVVGFEHSFKQGGGALTNLLTRGKPSGGVKRWLEVEGRPGVAATPDQQADDSADNVTVVASLGMLTITYDDPRTMDPPIDDWALTECHVNPGSGSFTPSGSTLRGIGRQTRFEIDSLIPGDIYSVILRILDGSGNIGAETTFVAEATQRVGPYHENNDGQFDQLIRNPDLNIYTLDPTANPPDGYVTELAAVWGSSDDVYFTDTDQRTGDKAIVFLTNTGRIAAQLIPFQGGDVVAYGFVAKAISISGTVTGRMRLYGLDAALSVAWGPIDLSVNQTAAWLTSFVESDQVHDDTRYILVQFSMTTAGANGNLVVDRILVQRGAGRLWAYKNSVSDDQAYTTGTVKVTWPTTVWDDGLDESTADEWTCRSPGAYLFDVRVVGSKATTFVATGHLQVDTGSGFTDVTAVEGTPFNASYTVVMLSHIVELDEGDVVRVAYSADAASTIAWADGSNVRGYFKAKQLTRVN